ncbi:hypothetical protein Poli38472_002643 [Pythium oligandrum]|uniref:PX domain-containing protein n=1 Tax=Pythium oligandrum TaxID=41045 RepID=A0A8K1CK39_PYTOL|nr:hypothetical protein Poli38472_002643 [Pythium oligandrum]|eukprot:TMW63702.1 hypothetical protein Poli38472_002643 [Pythium oligandrum]
MTLEALPVRTPVVRFAALPPAPSSVVSVSSKRSETKSYKPLRALASITVLPERYTERSHVLTALKQVESVAIRDSVKRDGHRYYVIDVHFKLRVNRIPTNRVGPSVCSARKPDLQVERRFSSFENLRNEIYYHCRSGHERDTPCGFCSKMLTTMRKGPAQPRLVAKMVNSERVVHKLLDRFLIDALNVVLEVDAYSGLKCEGQECVPALIKQFVLPDACEEAGFSLPFRESTRSLAAGDAEHRDVISLQRFTWF